MRANTARFHPKERPLSKETEQDKTTSKFNRKPTQLKEQKKRNKDIDKEDQRICFMSPEKISMLTVNNQPSFHSGRSPTYGQHPSSPRLLQEEESLIHKAGSDTNDNGKLNDSLLSMYNELNHQKQSEILGLKLEIAKLNILVEKLKRQCSALKEKEKDLSSLREFMITRETYICQIHEDNAELHQRNAKLNKQKEIALQETENVRKILETEQQHLKNQTNLYKSQCQLFKTINNQFRQENQELKQSLRKLEQKYKKQKIGSPHSLPNIDITNEEEDLKDLSPLLKKSSCLSPKKRLSDFLNDNLTSSLHLKAVQPQGPTSPSYLQLLSSRSNHQISKFDCQDQSDHFKHSNASKKCSCRATIQNLYQKIRYNQIQIDILKRVKAKGENVRNQNEKLKKQNEHLNNRIKYLNERKKQNKRKDSDSSLQLSLSLNHKR